MGKKKGPPYTDIPDCKFVVVVCPWGMRDPGKRSVPDYNRLGVWMRYMLRGQRKGLNSEDDIQVDAVYARNTVSTTRS